MSWFQRTPPTLEQAEREHQKAMDRELREVLPQTIDLSIYRFPLSTIRTTITLHPDGTWEQQL